MVKKLRFKYAMKHQNFLALVNEELPDVPFYYVQDRLCALAKIATSKITIFRSAILNAGYRVSPLT